MIDAIERVRNYFSNLSKFIIDYAVKNSYDRNIHYNLYGNSKMFDGEAKKYTDEFIKKYGLSLKDSKYYDHIFNYFRDVVRLQHIINPGIEFIGDSFKYLESVLAGEDHNVLNNEHLRDMIGRIVGSMSLSGGKIDLVDMYLRKLDEDTKKSKSLFVRLKKKVVKGVGIPLLAGVVIGGALMSYSKYKKKKEEEKEKTDRIDFT